MSQNRERSASPLLSIGLPVYNGEAHLAESLQSLLAQDIDDFELVISDNASNDATAEICQRFAAQDNRIRYSRTDTNVGAAANYNRVLSLCEGDYFMWGSDDDIWDPRFAGACVERLCENPTAVLCTSEVALIDAAGNELPARYDSLETLGMSLEDRVNAFLRRPSWYDIYSVFRPEAIRRTGGYQASFGGDVHLLLELLLLGDFCMVPEKLFRYRIPNQSKTANEYLVEIGVREMPGPQLQRPWTFLAQDLMALVEASPIGAQSVARIENRFVAFLASETSTWGETILFERGLPKLPPWAAEIEIREAMNPSAESTPRDARSGAWQMGPGVRLKTLRRLALRVLSPFTDRQDTIDARQDACIEILRRQNEELQGRVRELEAKLGEPEGSATPRAPNRDETR